jgi:hypothetical protein
MDAPSLMVVCEIPVPVHQYGASLLHDLRHTAATLALRGGTHPKQLQEMLGHARVAITLDVYSHVTEQMHAEAAQRIGRQLFEECCRPACSRSSTRSARVTMTA